MGNRCWRGHGDGRYSNYTCVTCHTENNKRKYAVRVRCRIVNPKRLLWVDGEYQFLREQGLTPQEIGEKHFVKWESFQRTLYRRVGPKEKW